MAQEKHPVTLRVRRAWVVDIEPAQLKMGGHIIRTRRNFELHRQLLRTQLRYGIKEAGAKEASDIVLADIPGNLPTFVQNLKTWLEGQGDIKVELETDE